MNISAECRAQGALRRGGRGRRHAGGAGTRGALASGGRWHPGHTRGSEHASGRAGHSEGSQGRCPGRRPGPQRGRTERKAAWVRQHPRRDTPFAPRVATCPKADAASGAPPGPGPAPAPLQSGPFVLVRQEVLLGTPRVGHPLPHHVVPPSPPRRLRQERRPAYDCLSSSDPIRNTRISLPLNEVL